MNSGAGGSLYICYDHASIEYLYRNPALSVTCTDSRAQILCMVARQILGVRLRVYAVQLLDHKRY